jgi:ABC-2 type transport system ATP-binding protein
MHIVVQGLTKRFGRLTALDEVSFELRPSQILVVLGANGAGKTTLLRCMAGVLTPSSGNIFYDGERFNRERIELRRRLYFMPEQTVGFWNYTIIEYITMILRLYEVEREGIEETVVQLLKEFDLLVLAYSQLGTLSRGQLYKAGLVAMLAVDAELWLVDEPNGIMRFKDHVSAARERGRTIIYTTQILEVAEKFCTHFCLLDEGRVHLVDSAVRLSEWSTGQAGGLENLFRKLRE